MAKKKKMEIENPRFSMGVVARAWVDVPLKANTIEEAIAEANERIKNEGMTLVENAEDYDYNLTLTQITDNQALEGF